MDNLDGAAAREDAPAALFQNNLVFICFPSGRGGGMQSPTVRGVFPKQIC